MSLIVVGSMAFDAIETPFGKSDKIIGGAATYIAWSASNFTRPIKQISVVGGDFPKEELKMLEARGVMMDGVQIKEDEKSFFWSGRYHLDMKTKKRFNFFNGALVAGFQFIHKYGVTVGNIKTNAFQHFILGANMIVQTGCFNANRFSKITH